MNIFTVLSQGKGRLNEENLSAMLGYLLTPSQTHGLGDTFLRPFLRAVADASGDVKRFDQITRLIRNCSQYIAKHGCNGPAQMISTTILLRCCAISSTKKPKQKYRPLPTICAIPLKHLFATFRRVLPARWDEQGQHANRQN